MKFEFKDGMVVDYDGSIHITKGDRIDCFISEDYIPANIKNDLREATSSGSKEDVQKIAVLLTDTVGSRACIADMDSKKCANW